MPNSYIVLNSRQKLDSRNMSLLCASILAACASGVSASHPAVTALERMVAIFDAETQFPQKTAEAYATEQLEELFAEDAVMWLLNSKAELAGSLWLTEESWARGGYCIDAADIALDTCGSKQRVPYEALVLLTGGASIAATCAELFNRPKGVQRQAY